MKTQIVDRLSALRKVMKEQHISAYIIPTTDPHMSEYPGACWKYRVWISGFTGSFGTVVVTLEKAGLWTDLVISYKLKINLPERVSMCTS